MHEHNLQFWDQLQPLHRQAAAFCRSIARSREDGDDLYQEAVCRAIESFDQLREMAAFRPRLYRIVINYHRNCVAAPWWRRFGLFRPEHERVVPPDRVSGPVHARIRLKIAMRSLSIRDRALVMLSDLEGWSGSELAELTKLSEDTVRARLSRARRKMKTSLLKHEAARGRMAGARTVCEGE